MTHKTGRGFDMIELTEEYVQSTAFNDSAFANAKKLVKGNKIVNTYITKEQNLIFGECLGSGKSNYKTSVDFVNPNEPIFRCSCPSRQIPCKHASALLYHYFLNASSYVEGEIPEDVASKREKIEKRAEKKKTETTKPKKVSATAFVKKMKQQLEGIQLVGQFINECLVTGFASIPMTQIKSYQKELVKELGNYYIPSYQAKVELVLETLVKAAQEDSDKKLSYYQEALTQLTKLQVLVKKSTKMLEEYIEAKKIIDVDSADLFTKMGYVWKLEELKALGFTKENRQLIQLGFYSYDDAEEKALIDVGYYVDLEDAPVYKALNIRPYKLLKRLKAEDTITELLETSEYAVYPGEMNKRIRWEGYTPAEITKEHIEKVREKAQTDFKVILKEVKNQLKDTLADEHPTMLVNYKSLVKYIDENNNQRYALKDDSGETILLGHVQKIGIPSTVGNIRFVLEKEDLEDQVMLGMFEYQEETNELIMQPLSVITQSQIKRLLG